MEYLQGALACSLHESAFERCLDELERCLNELIIVQRVHVVDQERHGQHACGTTLRI